MGKGFWFRHSIFNTDFGVSILIATKLPSLAVLAFTFMIMAGFMLPANAAVVYNNGGPTIDNALNVYGGSVIYDDFSLAADSSITSVGFYFTDSDNISTWDGVIDYQFHSDVGGPFGGLLVSGTGQNIAAVDSGLPGCCTTASPSWGNAWLVTFDLESSFAATSGVTYWLGLTGAGGPVGSSYWNTASPAGAGNGWVGPGSGSWDTTYELAFFLEGEPVPAIPLPAAFPLFGTGLGILGFLGWRRRRKAQAV